jgi:hypothetical protein
MNLSISISMDNAAFEDGSGGEVARILREFATKIDSAELHDGDTWKLMDINGNRVGRVVVSKD